MIIKKLLAVGLFCACSTGAFAEKLAVFNLEQALLNTKHAHQVISKLKADPQYKIIAAQAETLRADLKALSKEADINGLTWSQEETSRHRKKMEFKQTDLQLALKKLKAEEDAVLGPLGKELEPKLQKALNLIMKTEGIDVILRPEAFFLVNNKLDITRRVTETIDRDM